MTVPVPGVNVPEFDQLPAMLNAAEVVAKVPADMVKFVRVVVPFKVRVPEPSLVKLYEALLIAPPTVRVLALTVT